MPVGTVSSHRPSRGRRLAVGAVALTLVASPLIVSQAAAATPAVTAPAVSTTVAATTPAPGPVPPSPATVGEAADGLAEYQGQSVCSPSAKPGTLRLAALLRDTYGTDDIGIERSCSDGGQSEHKEGRALDWMVSLRVPAERAKATAFLTWLLAADAAGHPAAMAQRLGVMYIGWNSRIWRSYRAADGWSELKGCFTKTSPADDTYCHRDHVHLSLSWQGAAARTSYWGSTPDTRPMCSPSYGSSAAPPAVIGTAVVPVAAVRLVDTRTGKGADGLSCRLAAPRWSGDSRSLRVRATGVGGVPSDRVGAVRLAVAVIRSNAPTTLTVRGSGASSRSSIAVVQVGINGSKTGTAVVPVAADGYVSLRTSAGAADVAVSVTGYVASVPQPATPPASPPTTPPASPPTTPPATTPSPTGGSGSEGAGGTPTTVSVAPGVARWPGVNLRLGMRGPAVISVQKALLAKGYGIPSLKVPGARFGTFDADTRGAVTRWQRKHRKYGDADGVVRARAYVAITTLASGVAPSAGTTTTGSGTTTTAPSLPSGVPPYPGVYLRQGMRGPSVIALQKALIARGYAITSLSGPRPVFGTFDAATHAAVVAFQKVTPAYGSANGIVGPKTYAYLVGVLR